MSEHTIDGITGKPEPATTDEPIAWGHLMEAFPGKRIKIIDRGESTQSLLERITAQQDTQNRIINEVLAEVTRATEKFPGWPTDPLHALAVLGEEFGELTQAMLQRVYEPHKATAEDVRTEAVQTAAMAMRLLFSLDRYEYKPCAQHAQEATEIRQEPVEAPGD